MKKLNKLLVAMAAVTSASAFAQSDCPHGQEHPCIGPNTMAMAYAHVYTYIAPAISIGGGTVSNAPGADNFDPVDVDSNGVPADHVTQNTDTSGETAGINWVQNINLGRHSGTGLIEGWANFVVSANVQQYGIGCAASKLYKGNTPLPGGFEATPHDDPINVHTEAGCVIEAQNGNPISGLSNVLDFESGKAFNDGGFQFESTGIRDFHFNHPEPTQTVSLKVKWEQDDPEKRTGQYSGFIKLIAMIPDSGF